MFHASLRNEDPTLWKITTKNCEFIELKCETEKYDHYVFLKSVKIDNDCYKKEKQKFV